MILSKKSYLARTPENHIVIAEDLNPSYQTLARVDVNEHGFFLEYPEKDKIPVHLIVSSVRELESEEMIDYEIKAQDVIRFGRLALLVKHMSSRQNESKVSGKDAN
jgi:hypothetical protein